MKDFSEVVVKDRVIYHANSGDYPCTVINLLVSGSIELQIDRTSPASPGAKFMVTPRWAEHVVFVNKCLDITINQFYEGTPHAT